MKDGILIFLLAFLFGAWIFFYVRRTKEKKREQREMSEILENKVKSFVREGPKASIMKGIGDLPRPFRSCQRSVYPYYQKERRSVIERRKSRVQVGLIFEYIDRRQSDSTRYTEPDRRSGDDRRGKYWDRRQPQVAY